MFPVFRILDSSCGDMTWMPIFLRGRKDVDFTGFDIVPENIENHRKNFKEQNWIFEVNIGVIIFLWYYRPFQGARYSDGFLELQLRPHP